jgi:hypothetical protein
MPEGRERCSSLNRPRTLFLAYRPTQSGNFPNSILLVVLRLWVCRTEKKNGMSPCISGRGFALFTFGGSARQREDATNYRAPVGAGTQGLVAASKTPQVRSLMDGPSATSTIAPHRLMERFTMRVARDPNCRRQVRELRALPRRRRNFWRSVKERLP